MASKTNKFNIIKEDNEKIELEFDGVPVYYLNALRRYFINKVPVYAIDKVVFYENSSAFPDEYIAHRIGLIPIKADGELDVEKAGFYLDAQGPLHVLSSELKCNNKKASVAVSDIPIIKLKEGQTLRIEGKLRKSTGREHAKFQSGVSGYEIVSEKGNEAKGTIFFEGLYHKTARETLYDAFGELKADLEKMLELIEERKKE